MAANVSAGSARLPFVAAPATMCLSLRLSMLPSWRARYRWKSCLSQLRSPTQGTQAMIAFWLGVVVGAGGLLGFSMAAVGILILSGHRAEIPVGAQDLADDAEDSNISTYDVNRAFVRGWIRSNNIGGWGI